MNRLALYFFLAFVIAILVSIIFVIEVSLMHSSFTIKNYITSSVALFLSMVCILAIKGHRLAKFGLFVFLLLVVFSVDLIESIFIRRDMPSALQSLLPFCKKYLYLLLFQGAMLSLGLLLNYSDVVRIGWRFNVSKKSHKNVQLI